MIEWSGRRAEGVEFRLAAGFFISLALHAIVLINVPLSARSNVHPASTATLPRLTVMLASARTQADHAVPVLGALPSLELEGAASQFMPEEHAAPGNDFSAAPTSPALHLPLPEPQYFALSEVDTPPTVLHDIDTDPPELAQYSQGGKLVMQLWIDETGAVVRTAVLDSDLPAPFAASAKESFMRTVFAPGKKDGVPVRTRLSIEVFYRPR